MLVLYFHISGSFIRIPGSRELSSPFHFLTPVLRFPSALFCSSPQAVIINNRRPPKQNQSILLYSKPQVNIFPHWLCLIGCNLLTHGSLLNHSNTKDNTMINKRVSLFYQVFLGNLCIVAENSVIFCWNSVTFRTIQALLEKILHNPVHTNEVKTQWKLGIQIFPLKLQLSPPPCTTAWSAYRSRQEHVS